MARNHLDYATPPSKRRAPWPTLLLASSLLTLVMFVLNSMVTVVPGSPAVRQQQIMNWVFLSVAGVLFLLSFVWGFLRFRRGR